MCQKGGTSVCPHRKGPFLHGCKKGPGRTDNFLHSTNGHNWIIISIYTSRGRKNRCGGLLAEACFSVPAVCLAGSLQELSKGEAALSGRALRQSDWDSTEQALAQGCGSLLAEAPSRRLRLRGLCVLIGDLWIYWNALSTFVFLLMSRPKKATLFLHKRKD